MGEAMVDTLSRMHWVFGLASLAHTPARSDNIALTDELRDRASGIEYLFRVGVQLQL